MPTRAATSPGFTVVHGYLGRNNVRRQCFASCLVNRTYLMGQRYTLPLDIVLQCGEVTLGPTLLPRSHVSLYVDDTAVPCSVNVGRSLESVR